MQLFLRIPRVAKAFEVMSTQHAGQMYGDLPYFVHPLAVAERLVSQFDATEDQIIAALLHDVVEDTPMTVPDVANLFGASPASMVGLLTKDDSLDYQGNIYRIVESGNVGAMRVKLADNYVNISGDKSQMSVARREKLNSRYSWSIKTLSNVLGV